MANNLKFKNKKESVYNVYINGEPFSFISDIVSYEEIVLMIYGAQELQPSIVYKNSAEKNPDGILSPEKSVKIKDGTKLTVILTGNS